MILTNRFCSRQRNKKTFKEKKILGLVRPQAKACGSLNQIRKECLKTGWRETDWLKDEFDAHSNKSKQKTLNEQTNCKQPLKQSNCSNNQTA